MISVVIPYVNREHIDECITAVRQSNPRHQIICEYDEEREGYSKTCNRGRLKAGGRFVVFLNDDCIVRGDALEVLADYLSTHPAVQAVGPYVENPDGTPGLAYGRLPDLAGGVAEMFRLHHVLPRFGRGAISRPGCFRVGYVSCCLMIRADQSQWFDESFNGYYTDVDFCRRLHIVHHVGSAWVMHYGSVSYGSRHSGRMDEGLWHYCLKHSTPLTYYVYRLSDKRRTP